MTKFNQLCVFEGTFISSEGSVSHPSKSDIAKFVKWAKETFGVRVKYEATVLTLPDTDKNGNPVKDTGGRHDLFFYVADEDVMKFAVPRLQYGIRWWEDVIGNGGASIYPSSFLEAHPCAW